MVDSKVIKDFVSGKRSGFNQLYGALSPSTYAVILRYVRCEDDAKEVLQETFIKVYNHRETYDESKPVGPWVRTIAIRTALNFIRERAKFKLTEDEYYFDRVTEEECAPEENNLKERLMSVLEKLPAGYRMVFSLYAIDNLTHKEIAEYLGISIGTSKSQYSKAKRMIQSMLQMDKVA